MRANQPFIFFFIHHSWQIWEERVLWEAVFIIQTSYKMQYFTIFQDKLHSFNIQDHRGTRRLLVKQFKNFPKSTIRPAGCNFWQAPNLRRNFKTVTVQRDREFIEFHFLLMVLQRCVILQPINTKYSSESSFFLFTVS